jgi:hypothetical protein
VFSLNPPRVWRQNFPFVCDWNFLQPNLHWGLPVVAYQLTRFTCPLQSDSIIFIWYTISESKICVLIYDPKVRICKIVQICKYISRKSTHNFFFGKYTWVTTPAATVSPPLRSMIRPRSLLSLKVSRGIGRLSNFILTVAVAPFERCLQVGRQSDRSICHIAADNAALTLDFF